MMTNFEGKCIIRENETLDETYCWKDALKDIENAQTLKRKEKQNETSYTNLHNFIDTRCYLAGWLRTEKHSQGNRSIG